MVAAGEPGELGRVGLEPVEVIGRLLAEQELDLAELGGLEAARVGEEGTERGELERRHRLQHVELGDQRLEDLEDPGETVVTLGGGVIVERPGERVEFVQYLLEPQFVDLMNDDEEGLVVFGLAGLGVV